MSELGSRVFTQARRLRGAPFAHHYKLNGERSNVCDGGRITTADCMQRGLNEDTGIDCSGLIVLCFAKTLNIAPECWPHEIRHSGQLLSLSADSDFSVGDVRLFTSEDGKVHTGIAEYRPRVAVHASGKSGIVEQSTVTERSQFADFAEVRTISAERLADYVLARCAIML